MALSFLAKCYSIENNKKVYFYIVDHKIRKNSTFEATLVKKKLKSFQILSKILTIKKENISKNIQSFARENRYKLIIKQSLIKKIDMILTAHHSDDLIENFFIRLLRGSGLNGLLSFKKKYSKLQINNKILIFRPLLIFSKHELVYISKNTYGDYIKDPSNFNDNYLRVYVRNILTNFKFNKKNKNFDTSLLNLHKSNKAIEYYVQKNIDENVVKNRDKVIVNKNFFLEPDEVVFRSLSIVLNSFVHKSKLSRGSKIMNLINNLKNSNDKYKTTLSGCIFKKVSNTMIISRES